MDSNAQCSQDDADTLDTAIWETMLQHAHIGGKTSISVWETLELLTESLSPDGTYTGALLRPSEATEHLRYACPWREIEGSIQHLRNRPSPHWEARHQN
jgi:hypothetical protein